MKPGRQWLVFDADFYDNTFTLALTERFGWAGAGLFIAFLCACKRGHTQGKIKYRNEFEALEMMGVSDLPLTDPRGLPFTLDEFWAFTGRFKQTSRTTQGHTIYVSATGWEDWQKSLKTVYERERKRRWRAESVRDNVPADTDTDTDTETRGTRSLKNHPQTTPVREWEPTETDEPVVDLKTAMSDLPWRKNVDG